MVRPVTDDDIGLKVLREAPEAEATEIIDIVAIHGLGAHPDDSWCKNVGTAQEPKWINWLTQDTMLPAVANNARIMRYGYQSGWFGCEAMRQRVSTVAQRLLLRLRNERKDFPFRPLIFIAHCFGGLVVLKALLDTKDDEDKWPGIFISTTGLIFFGTPFRGTEGMSQNEMLEAALREYEPDQIQSEALRILEPGNESLQDLMDKFGTTRSQPNKANVACFFELKSTDVGAIVGRQTRTRFVVNESSGCLDLSEATEKYSLSRTHFDMNKFGKPSEEDFLTVREVIERMLENAPRLVRARSAHIQDPFLVSFTLSDVNQIEHFVARQDELSELHQKLQNNGSRRTVVIHGSGGMGKTQLAIAYADYHRTEYSGFFWLNAKDVDSLQQSFVKAAERVLREHPTAPHLRAVNIGGSPDEVVDAMRRWLDLQYNTRWLLIYDNYDDHDAFSIRDFFPEAHHGSVVITTRVSRGVKGHRISLNKITDIRDSLQILFDASHRQEVWTNPDAQKLVKKLDGLPLALATAGAYLDQVATSFAEYLHLYNTSWLRLQRASPELDSYDRTLYSTWQLSFDHVQQQNQLSAKLLKLWAYFDSQDLWFELLSKGTIDCPEWFSQLIKDGVRFTAAMRVLCDYGLSEVCASLEAGLTESRGYSMHSCIHDWTIFVLNKEWDKYLARLALHCVASKVPIKDEINSWILQRRLLQHAIRQEQAILEDKVDMEGMEWALHSLGNLYADQGKLAEAEEMYVRALQGCEEALGPDHTSTLDMVNSLGLLYADQGKLAEAEKMYVRALQGKEKALGPDHTSTLDTVNNLGSLYANQGKLAEAEEMYVRALQGCEEALGPDHTSTLNTVNSLGLLYENQGKLAEAEAMFTRALQGYEQALGPELLPSYLPALSTMFAFGDLFSRTGRKDLAKVMYSRALAGYTTVQGPSSKWCKRLEDRLQALQVVSPELEVGQDEFTEPGIAKSKAFKQKLRQLGRRLNIR